MPFALHLNSDKEFDLEFTMYSIVSIKRFQSRKPMELSILIGRT
jgi:hypothetical protein